MAVESAHIHRLSADSLLILYHNRSKVWWSISINPYVIKLECLFGVSFAVFSSSPPPHALLNSFSVLFWGEPACLYILLSCFWIFSHLNTFCCKFCQDIRLSYWSRSSLGVRCLHLAQDSSAEFQRLLPIHLEGELAADRGKDNSTNWTILCKIIHWPSLLRTVTPKTAAWGKESMPRKASASTALQSVESTQNLSDWRKSVWV